MEGNLCVITVFILYYFAVEGNFQVEAPVGLYSEGLPGFLCYEFEGLILGILR